MNKLREMPDPSFVNFIARCLEWDPKKRLSPDEGLQHEWIIKGLPPNIILHNPHNNPYSRSNQNSSEQY
jgi:dual specificity tyrosine-phosphorylation-regulated kinase 2/3/4